MRNTEFTGKGAFLKNFKANEPKKPSRRADDRNTRKVPAMKRGGHSDQPRFTGPEFQFD